jgi:signal transduction histidine kinase
MPELNDQELIEELKRRFAEKERALYDLRMTTRRLEDVNRRLVESERLKSDFLSNIRNEINNPLAAIHALAREIASGAVADPADCAALAASIYQESFALDLQMRNILCAAEIEAGETALSVAHVDVARLVADLVGSFELQAQAAGIRLLHTESDERGPEAGGGFCTDAAKLQVILGNLLSNALKFSHGGGEVVVEARVLPGTLSLSVRDGGIGIDEADHRAIFERFRQLEGGRTKSYAGHGLGLSIVQALVEFLGGSVAVESARGRGSSFTVRLPEAAAEAAAGVFSDAGNEFFFTDEKF